MNQFFPFLLPFLLRHHLPLGTIMIRIFNANGDNWRVQRKTASKIFSRKAFATFMSDVFIHHGQTFLDILGKAADSNKQIDIQDLFYRFTLDSIGQIGFGVELDVLKKGRIPFSEAFDQSQAHIISRFLNPAWFLLKSVSPEGWRQTERLKLMANFIHNIIEARRKEGPRDQMDILSFFMERTDENGKPFTEKYLQDIVMNFLIAGIRCSPLFPKKLLGRNILNNNYI
jgi:cytochrome P450